MYVVCFKKAKVPKMQVLVQISHRTGNQLGLKPAKMTLSGISSKHAIADLVSHCKEQENLDRGGLTPLLDFVFITFDLAALGNCRSADLPGRAKSKL